ncbi:MAG: ROK family protein [Leptolyngbya sp. SIO4C1]|nr:ROK family protein [Leptolyngbya sp. SIO4C1]
MQQVIGIDLGGTAIKLGLVTAAGEVVRSLSVPTPQPSYPEPVIAAIVNAVAQLDPTREATAIGLGMPGPADRAGRVAQISINLDGWLEVPVADWLEAQTGYPVTAENDANCAAIGEAWLGAGRQFQDWILLTLGTGVGGAIFLNGQLFTGHSGAAGELGLITIDPNGPVCNSGNSGSLEQHCSMRALQRETGQSPQQLAEAARAGNPDAIALWQQYGRLLGAGIANHLYVLTPEAVVLGGGMSALAPLFMTALSAEIEARVLLPSRAHLQILIAELGNQAGLIGAAKLAFSQP